MPRSVRVISHGQRFVRVLAKPAGEEADRVAAGVVRWPQALLNSVKDKFKGERCALVCNGPSLNKIKWDWQENFKVVI